MVDEVKKGLGGKTGTLNEKAPKQKVLLEEGKNGRKTETKKKGDADHK